MHKEIVQWLLTVGNVNPSAKNRLNLTPLEVAKMMGCYSMVDLLENSSSGKIPYHVISDNAT